MIAAYLRKLFHRDPRAPSVYGVLRYRWVEESFSATQPLRNQRPLPGSALFMGNAMVEGTIRLMRGALLVMILVMMGRIIYLQGVRGNYFFETAEDNRIRIHVIPAKRGSIFDRQNRPLVTNTTSFALVIVPQDLPRDPRERTHVLQKTAALTALREEDLTSILEEYKKYSFEAITVREGIPYETALTVQVKSADLPGIRVESGSDRRYTNVYGAVTTSTPQSLSHLIGYVGKLSKKELEEKYMLGYTPLDRIGKIGIEAQYEDFLRGNYGKKKVEVDVSGREQLVLAEIAPTAGRHVVLGINSEWQKHLEDALKRALRAANAKRGSAIALDPQTGTIRAFVSLPTYDNNDFIGGISAEKYQELVQDSNQPLFNRALSGQYPSGSTIKPMLATAALEESIITRATTVLSTGGLEVGQWFFPDWKAGGHGATTIVKALAESVNTFFYIIGGGYRDTKGLGVEKITTYLHFFGFGDRLGIDLPGEATGFIPSPTWKEQAKHEQWYIGDTYNISIGQGDLLVTPLQIAVATAAIANGGTLYRPHLVERIIDPVSGEVQPVEPQIIRELPIKKEHLALARAGMRACVQTGSCRALAVLPISVAGKTGTAQWSREKNTHAWFTGFAPHDDPRFVITIMIEEGGEGSKTALPVAAEFLRIVAKE